MLDNANIMPIEFVSGNIAPRYEESVKRLLVKQVIVTENGMQSGFPLIDFQLIDDEGNEYFYMATGKNCQMLAAAIAGCNMRNHGVREP